MSKHSRQQIPEPTLSAPAEVRTAPASVREVPPVPAPALPAAAPALAVVAPPPRVAKVELLADRILVTNPTILLTDWVELGPDGKGGLIQKKKLTPALAVVMHGEIWIEELGLMLPIGAAVIRTF